MTEKRQPHTLCGEEMTETFEEWEARMGPIRKRKEVAIVNVWNEEKHGWVMGFEDFDPAVHGAMGEKQHTTFRK